ncbi:MAG: HD domain-containing protein, partial [Erysipelotrichaceae bacterium]|nr:HD domain-containing protein [Erysipelotrichaceae bacterium]
MVNEIQSQRLYNFKLKAISEETYEELLWTMVEETLVCSAHDIDHVRRVYKLALKIAANYDAVDYEVLIPATLLHDLGRRVEDQDPTGKTDHAMVGSAMAHDILERMGIEPEIVSKIQAAIETHRFRSDRVPGSLEAAILFDADKLDAIGAVGIARSYMLAGQEGSKLYREVDLEAYGPDNLTDNGRIMRLEAHAPNIEYLLKLKHIPDRLMTEAAKKIAVERAAVMKAFFYALDHEMGMIGDND